MFGQLRSEDSILAIADKDLVFCDTSCAVMVDLPVLSGPTIAIFLMCCLFTISFPPVQVAHEGYDHQKRVKYCAQV